MGQVVIENPVLNSPFSEPTSHFKFSNEGITNEIINARRTSSYFIPVAQPKKKGKQLSFDTEWIGDRIKENEFINQIRSRVSIWRSGGYHSITKTTRQLLEYWLIFIEKEETRFAELQRLKADFPSVQNDIILVNTDANAYIKDLCHNYTWNTNRAVFFLDPFGMQVEWDTIIAIAETRAIDLWILCPLGVAVNRLLKKDGNINESIRKRLDTIFGASDWYNAFYQTRTTANLFGEQSYIEKVGNFDSIGHYFVDRLKTVFAGVANNPLPLLNTRNIPLYLLCFASGNQRGAEIAVRIAEHILGR